ncbi:MAG: hypothetical protein QOE33_78 [Acidobacteriota bacterium]|nr:hypothetical protein [Acidobacteriota bacterium]
MSTNQITTATGGGATPVAKEAPTEQQSSQAGTVKRFAKGQTVCNERNEKGKLCNGHLKQTSPVNEDAIKHLRGEDVPFKCQSCGALYVGPPLGHLRDPRKQSRFTERELVEILQAAGGTLPAIKKNERGVFVLASEAAPAHAPATKPTATTTTTAKPATSAQAPAPTPIAAEETLEQKRERKKAEAAARRANSIPIPGASGPPPEGETPEQKMARLKAVVEEAKRRKAAGETDSPIVVPSDVAPSAPPLPSPTSGRDSSPSADAHRPAAEAQAATGAASAAPLSPAAATASPAAGAETVADLGTDASTELTPGAPRDGIDAKPKKDSHSGFKVPAELQPRDGESPQEKIERLRRTVEAAKRAAGKL